MKEEVNVRIVKGNKCGGMLQRLMRNKPKPKKAKVSAYNTVTRPVVIYSAGIWTLAESSERILVWERRILRRIYGGIKEENR